MKIKFRKGETGSNAVVKIANAEEKVKEVNVQNSPKLSTKDNEVETGTYVVLTDYVLTGYNKPVIVEYKNIVENVPLSYDLMNYVKKHYDRFCYGVFEIGGKIYLSSDLEIVADDNNKKFVRVKGQRHAYELKSIKALNVLEPFKHKPISSLVHVVDGKFVHTSSGLEPNIVSLENNGKIVSMKNSSVIFNAMDNYCIYIVYNKDGMSEAQLGNSVPCALIDTDITNEVEYTFDEDLDKDVHNPMLTRLASILAGQTFKIAPAFRSTLNTYVKQMKDGNISMSSLSSLSSILRLEFSVFPSIEIDKMYDNLIGIKIPIRSKSNMSVYGNFDESAIDALIAGVKVPSGVFGLRDIRSRIASNTLTIGDIQTIIENAVDK